MKTLDISTKTGNMISKIKKRSGELVDFDAAKLNLWGQWAASLNVDWSSVVLGATRKCFNECTTEDIQNAMISECVDRETTPHLKMANRLYMGIMYKKVFGDWRNIPDVDEMFLSMVELGLWSNMDYSKEELSSLNSVINHHLDLEATYTESKQILEKYALKDMVNDALYETPQFVYMRMALGNMEKMPKDRRMNDVGTLYRYLSQKKINPPTPFSLNLGTEKKQYASCCVTTTLDTAASLAAQDHIAYMMTCAGAGIGSHIKSRSIGDGVRGGRVQHQGKLPYYRVQQAAVLANMQSGRGGANTMHFNVLDPELLDLLSLKNVQTIDQKRIKDLDYSVGINFEFARRVAKNESWMLVSYGDAPDLYEAMYLADGTTFLAKYYEVESDPAISKIYVNARDIAIKFISESMENRFYFHRTDEMNRHTPFKDPIYSSNLCVAPETKVLTKQGYLEIASIVDKEVEVWNGEEWSQVTIKKTGSKVNLIKVITENGYELECTPQHKFYISTNYRGGVLEVQAKDLTPGDKLIKFSLPIIESEDSLVLDNAYANGFYSGDGCLVGKDQRIYFYGDKVNLKKYCGDIFTNHTVQPNDNREYAHTRVLKDKFFVPDALYSIKSRLEWLSGILDSEGTLTSNSGTESFQIVSINQSFLKEIQLMLQTLGVTSKVNNHTYAGVKSLSSNKVLGEKKEYYCQKAYRLLIANSGVNMLMSLGLSPHRVIPNDNIPSRNAEHFIKIESVIDLGRIDDTYCFTEPKRHMGMFNGILTGQCQEIALPTHGYDSVQDLYKNEAGTGEIGLCSLGAICAGNVTEEEYEDVAYYTTLMIDNVIDIMEYPFPQLAVTAKARRSIGVGITNLAHDMAKNKLKYTELLGKQYVHRLAETHSYFLHKASLRLAKERGVCEWIGKTKYPEGWLPIDTANKEVDKVIGQPLMRDWEALRREIIEFGGIRNSVLEAHMPCESSSIGSNSTNSLYPLRNYKVIKTNGTKKNLFIAPELDTLKEYYELASDIPVKDLTEIYAIVQKFTGQAISADFYVDYSKYQDRVVGTKELLAQFLYKVKLGMKTQYYINSLTGVDLDILKEESEPECSGCKL